MEIASSYFPNPFKSRPSSVSSHSGRNPPNLSSPQITLFAQEDIRRSTALSRAASSRTNSDSVFTSWIFFPCSSLDSSFLLPCAAFRFFASSYFLFLYFLLFFSFLHPLPLLLLAMLPVAFLRSIPSLVHFQAQSRQLFALSVLFVASGFFFVC